eukprot:scaffold13676_cov30-Tisochrysis_lutea.AAC.2
MPPTSLLALLLCLPSGRCLSSALCPGDTVAVIGASGNVGKLVALRLAESYTVHAVSRSPERVEAFFSSKPSIRLFGAELKGTGASEALREALRDAQAVVVCTGTTAFPTKAWSPDGKEGVGQPTLQALLGAKLDVRKAVAALDAKGFNTPRNVDTLANLAVLDAWREAAGAKRKRFVLMSSIGVQRREQMPFPILNTCGVLDAKAEAEAALRVDAVSCAFMPSIAQPRPRVTSSGCAALLTKILFTPLYSVHTEEGWIFRVRYPPGPACRRSV